MLEIKDWFRPFCIKCYLHVFRIAFVFFGDTYLRRTLATAPRNIAIDILKLGGAVVGDQLSLRQNIIIDNFGTEGLNKKFKNLKIGNNVFVGDGAFFDLPENILIEDEVIISARSAILTHADCGERALRKYFHRKVGAVTIGRGSWIGFGAIVLPGVRIGQCCIVGAGSVVTKSIPDYSVVAGIPAKVIRTLA